MTQQVIYTSQTRLSFDIDRLVEMDIDRAFVTPFVTNNEILSAPEVILSNLELLADKAKAAAKKGLEVFPFFVTINHPEGNFQLPKRYRMQTNIDGSPRDAFICFRDKIRQQEMLRYAAKAAELGFGRMGFDDDMRDAFCYCDEYLNGFTPFASKSREQIAEILNGVLSNPEHEELRKQWYQYKYDGMVDYAHRLEQAIHNINPKCRIGICTSAKRCQDFSGRDPLEWLKIFSTPQVPAFARLCGECYDDDITHLVQSTGWHQYFDRCFPNDIERMCEITSVPAISYRSAGNVLLETKAVVAATAKTTVHWAWTEELDKTPLGDFVGPVKDDLAAITDEIKEPSISPLALYVGSELGAYTPINISTSYGATHDPMTAYNIISLVGLPITVVPTIPSGQQSILCCGYISRDMISNIDEYIQSGGVAIIDAKAAQCYKTYDGKADFTIDGPVSLHRYELTPTGQREDMVSECLPDCIYTIQSTTSKLRWTGYDISDNITGSTTAVIPYGKGKLIVLGYDLSRTNTVLLRPQWRDRMIAMLKTAGVEFSTYWNGNAAVQCLYYGDKVALANYNSSPVSGELIVAGKEQREVELKAFELKIVKL